ncbi:hypothetical protein RHGRI_028618 [Rhododendron griersonianum]|uniref:Aminotransferase-like plant mobile domain-containing protein n=1 Tax=Rhododendron griersonianum TaxID=479676 RepID=A0AAV6IGI9_9ERIC|nr:hypothetical protein RHGRI_028618 [Rhododendron griersonianum]
MDFWKQAQQWLPAFEKLGYTVPPPMKFTIHGIWAENFIGLWPAPPCPIPQTPFNVALMNCHMRQRMMVSWPNVEYGAHEKFWNYEWHTHEDFSKSLYDQVAFFTIALDLKDRFDLVKIPNAAQMHWSFSIPLDLGNLNATILAAITGVLILSCSWVYNQAFGRYGEVLKEVRICFDLHFMVINYPPRNDPNDCIGPIIYLV